MRRASLHAGGRTESGDTMNGYGVHVGEDGARYEGEWTNGERQGQGMHSDGYGKYKGQWHEGKKHGQGVFFHPSGAKYEGPYQDDMRHGKGVFAFAVKGGNPSIGLNWQGGDSYEGDFEEDCRHGHGTWRYADGRAETGQYAKGIRVGTHKVSHSGGRETLQTYGERGAIIKMQ